MVANNTHRTTFCKPLNTPRQFQRFYGFRTLHPMESWRTRFRDRFTMLKHEKGLTQEELAEKIGITQGTVGHWLNGRRSPEDLESYEKLASALGMHPAELLYGVKPTQTVSDDGLELAKEWEKLPSKQKLSIKTVVAELSNPARKGGRAS